jgi:hypothetical protein
MTLADLFEFSSPRASRVFSVKKPGEVRVERSEIPTPAARKVIRTRKDKDA